MSFREAEGSEESCSACARNATFLGSMGIARGFEILRRTRVALAAALTVLSAGVVLAQAESNPAHPALLIVSPPDHATIAPGDRLSVRVEMAPGATVSAISAVAVMAEKPLGLNLTKGPPPANLNIRVPDSAPSGLYHLTALARDGNGQLLSSFPITVDVERSLPPLALRLEPARLEFRALGETLPVRASGMFPGAASVDLSRSHEVEFTSLDPRVATVDDHGLVSAAGPGSTEIVARYRSGPMAKLPAHVAAPAVMALPASIRFQPQAVGTSSDGQSTTVTNHSAEPLEITAVRASGDFSLQEDCLHSSPLPPGGTCFITVTFTPTASRKRIGAVSLATRTTTVDTMIPLEGEGKVSQ